MALRYRRARFLFTLTILHYASPDLRGPGLPAYMALLAWETALACAAAVDRASVVRYCTRFLWRSACAFGLSNVGQRACRSFRCSVVAVDVLWRFPAL